ncbi:MAG: hypothetical protein WD052_02445 [Bacteroidales bacterium]
MKGVFGGMENGGAGDAMESTGPYALAFYVSNLSPTLLYLSLSIMWSGWIIVRALFNHRGSLNQDASDGADIHCMSPFLTTEDTESTLAQSLGQSFLEGFFNVLNEGS